MSDADDREEPVRPRRAGPRRRSLLGTAAIVAAVALVAVVLVWRHDHRIRTDASLTAGAVAAPDLPLLGPSDGAAWSVTAYQPGRSYQVLIDQGDGTSWYRLSVVAWPGGIPSSVRAGLPVDWTPTRVQGVPAAAGVAAGVAGLTWQASPDAQASLLAVGAGGVVVSGATTTTVASPLDADQIARLVAVASSLAPVGHAAWQAALDRPASSQAPSNPPGSLPHLGLTQPDELTEIAGVGFGSITASLLADGVAPGHAVLETQALSGPSPITERALEVRRQPAAWLDAGGVPGVGSQRYAHRLVWAEDGALLQLLVTSEVSRDQAVGVAESLVTLTDDEWQALLFPTTIHTDLVPLPPAEGVLLPTAPPAPTSLPTSGG